MDALIIGGHYSVGRKDSLRHTDDFRLRVDNVTMSLPNLVHYFDNDRHFDDPEKRAIAEERRPYRQVYWSGLHLLNLMLAHGYTADLLHCHSETERSRLKLYAQNPRVVIISTTFMNIAAARSVVADVREHLPSAIIVMGGAYVRYSYLVLTHQDNLLYQDPEVQDRYFFTTEAPVKGVNVFISDQHGELALLDMMEASADGKIPTDMPNTIVADSDGNWRVNEQVAEAYDIVKHRIRWKKIPRVALSTVTPFQNTYGCPFKCGFCNFSLTKVHKKDMGMLMDELLELAEQGVSETVWFTDDNFFLNEKLIIEFCERFIEIGAPFQWNSFVRASSISPKTVDLLKRSRCSLLILGLESGSQTILDNMWKKDTIEHYAESIKLLVEADIDLELSFIFGYPGECERTVEETMEFINKVPTSPTQRSYLYLFKFNVLPLSPVFEQDEREKWGLTGNFADWRHNTMQSEQVQGFLKKVAQTAEPTVFNYIDPAMGLDRRQMKDVMVWRDKLARHILANGNTGDQAAVLWDRLENSVRGHLPSYFSAS